MQISTLSQTDKMTIAHWNYEGMYAKFNYALDKNGWIDQYCCEGSFCYKVSFNGKIIGLFLFIPKNKNEFRVLINPQFIHQGYGTKVVKKAIDYAFQELKFKMLTLIVRKEHQIGLKLYQKFGFEILGERVEMIENEKIVFFEMIKQIKEN